MPLSTLFRRRLAFLLESLNLSHKEFAEKISSHDAHKDHITSSLVSHWLSGKRDPTPYITQISQVLRPALKYQLHFSNGDLLQEISDWYGLLALPNLEKALRAQFPAWQEPLRVGNFPRLQLPAYHVARPELTSALIYKLLAPDPENGLFHRNGLALTGWPGVGKSILAFELMKKAHPFFSGGVLFGNLKRASSHQILLQWAHELNLSKPEEQSPTNLALAINMKLIKTGGRWLCILDAVSDFGELNEILLPHPWILITTHGTQPLLPHGLEDWASPLPPFTQEESIAVFQKRLGTQWEKYNDPQKVKKLHRLVEGLPLAISILAGLVHSRGWEYTLTRFQDEMRIISTVKLSPGTQPEISLQLTIDLALAAVPSELHHLLKAMSVFAPGMAIPSFLVEMFLKKFREIEEKPGAWLAKLETLRESGLIESFEVEDDPGLRYWRIHRIVALYISGQILPEMVSLLHRQMKVLLSQHALAAQAHPCVPSLVLPALKRRQTTWPHLVWLQKRLIEWFQGKRLDPKEAFCNQEVLQYDALYLSRFMHALFGPETALAYLQQLIPIVAGNPELLLSWASCKLSTDESIEVIERLEAFLETQSDNKSPSIQRAHAYLGRAYLIQAQPELASKHFAFLEKRMPHLSTQETPHYVFATAEVYFALGKQAAFHGVDEMAEALLIQTVIAYCWGDLPVVVKTQPGIPFGNAQMEETGRHYPWLVRLMEAVWELVEFYERLSLYQEAYALAREGTRLALSMPWGYALDHLFLLVKLSCLVGNKLNAEQVRQVLARGEPLFEQPPMRSKLAETFLLSDRKIAREQLVKLAHAYRRAKAPKWAAEAQTLAEHPLVGLDSDCDPVPLEKQGPFLRARLALERWQDHLGLSGFLSDDHPLPDPLPW